MLPARDTVVHIVDPYQGGSNSGLTLNPDLNLSRQAELCDTAVALGYNDFKYSIKSFFSCAVSPRAKNAS
jgi:hypothetical protein